MKDTINIKGVEYEGFSVEMVQFGGHNKAFTISELKRHGIKVNTSQAYTPYMGHWAMLVEAKCSKEVSDWLWSGKQLKDHTKESK